MQPTTPQILSPAPTSRPRPVLRLASALRRLAGYLSRGVSIDSVCLLAFAVIGELPALMARGVILLVAQVLLNLLIGPTITTPLIQILLAALWLWAPLALFCPLGGGWWWRQIEGGRHPSQRERLAYQDSIELLQSQSPRPLHLPTSWFVIDTPLPNAAVCGETLMLSRGILESEHLPAVIAHELGHLTSTDGRLTAAINRMVPIPPRIGTPNIQTQPEPEHAHSRADQDPHHQGLLLMMLWLLFKLLLLLARGGLALWLTRPLWGIYWREREYKADAYAADLGQAEELADFLDLHALIHDQPVPFIWLTEHTHPPTELRIDRLRAHTDRQARQPLLDAAR